MEGFAQLLLGLVILFLIQNIVGGALIAIGGALVTHRLLTKRVGKSLLLPTILLIVGLIIFPWLEWYNHFTAASDKKQDIKNMTEALHTLDFVIYTPQYIPPGMELRIASLPNYASSNETNYLHLRYSPVGYPDPHPVYRQTEISIDEFKVPNFFNPPTQCYPYEDINMSCRLVTKTPQGKDLYKEAGGNYYVRIHDTLLVILQEALSEEELVKFIDSFRERTSTTLQIIY